MSNFLQKQSMNERLLRTEDDSSKEEGTFYENPMNKENNNNTVQNNNNAYDNKYTMPQSVKYALRFIFVCTSTKAYPNSPTLLFIAFINLSTSDASYQSSFSISTSPIKSSDFRSRILALISIFPN